jgi:hypothetical protein
MSETVPESRPINNTPSVADLPSMDTQPFDVKPVVLHRVRHYLMELSERYRIPVGALCGFEFVIMPRKTGASGSSGSIDLLCPACDCLYGLMRS